MKCLVRITQIEGGNANIRIADKQEEFLMPAYLLPTDSKAGDVLQLQLNFCPFETLAAMKKEES